MKRLIVDLGERRYPIYIGEELYGRLPEWLDECGIASNQKLFMISDSNVAPLYAEKVVSPLRKAGFKVEIGIVPAGESSKNLAQYEKLIEKCLKFGLDRKSVILALGGGVVGDLAGFVAATYMRGIPFIQLPTTLLAHDSSVGGKVGINHVLGKNVIGAFHQPLMVIFDLTTLSTLSERELRSGLAEVVKHALIRDYSFVQWLEDHAEKLLQKDFEALGHAIFRGCQIKAEVVAMDEREQGLRAILNYGHTVGHALEAITHYTHFTHGEAIAIGMVGEAYLSQLVLGTSKEVFQRTKALIRQFNLPTCADVLLHEEEMIQLMRRDKKAERGAFAFVLAKEIGKVQIVWNVNEGDIQKMLQVIQPKNIHDKNS